MTGIGPAECRQFWGGILGGARERRQELVARWIRSATRASRGVVRLADVITPLLRRLLYGLPDFSLHSSHCALLDGLPVPYELLVESERRFVLECARYRHVMWARVTEGNNGELACVGYRANNSLRVRTWHRLLARDACELLQGARAEVAAALQRLLLEHPADVFLLALHDAVQGLSVGALPCVTMTRNPY